MGYSLYIGEAVMVFDAEDRYCCIDVQGERHDNAPAFGEPTDYTNSRCPSYTTWSNFCEAVGLKDLFYNDSDGLIRPHPGTNPLKKSDLVDIEAALEKQRLINPNAGYGEGDNYWLPRLEWLHYWIKWALENCKHPVIRNT